MMSEFLKQPLDRRSALKLAVAIGAAAAAEAVLGACSTEKPVIVPTPYSATDTLALVNQRMHENAQRPIIDQIKAVERIFQSRPITPESAKDVLVPLWTKAYIEYSGTNLREQDITSKVRLERLPGELLGRVHSPDGSFEGKVILLDIFKHQSNSSVLQKDGSRMLAIDMLGGIFAHELSHFDVAMKQNPRLGKHLYDPSLKSPIIPEEMQVIGLSGVCKTEEGKYRYLLDYFEEMTSDIAAWVHWASQR